MFSRRRRRRRREDFLDLGAERFFGVRVGDGEVAIKRSLTILPHGAGQSNGDG